jgi:DNA-binding FadR family transcriptional regulator
MPLGKPLYGEGAQLPRLGFETMKVNKVRQKTIVEQVMDQFKDLIASGQLRPHDKIPTESELAQMFGIGRSSVREAIKIFQYLGILEASPRKGTFVATTQRLHRGAHLVHSAAQERPLRTHRPA